MPTKTHKTSPSTRKPKTEKADPPKSRPTGTGVVRLKQSEVKHREELIINEVFMKHPDISIPKAHAIARGIPGLDGKSRKNSRMIALREIAKQRLAGIVKSGRRHRSAVPKNGVGPRRPLNAVAEAAPSRGRDAAADTQDFLLFSYSASTSVQPGVILDAFVRQLQGRGILTSAIRVVVGDDRVLVVRA